MSARSVAKPVSSASPCAVCCAFIVAVWGAPPAAAETFTAPEGCDHFATAHLENCTTWFVLRCVDSDPRYRRVYEYENGALKGVMHLRGGVVEVDYDETDRNRPMDIEYSNPEKIDQFDPMTSSDPLRLSGEFAKIENGVPIYGAINAEYHPVSRRLRDLGAEVWEAPMGLTFSFEIDDRNFNVVAQGVDFFAPKLGSKVGYRVVRDFGNAKDVIDKSPIVISLRGEAGFDTFLCGARSALPEPRRIAQIY